MKEQLRPTGVAQGFLSCLLLLFINVLVSISLEGKPIMCVPGRILLKAKPYVSETDLQKALRLQGAVEEHAIQRIQVRVLKVDPERMDWVLARLAKSPLVEFAEPDLLLEPQLIPNDPSYSLQWSLPKMQAPSAWDVTSGSSNIIVALLDSGIDPKHPDLAANLVSGWNCFDNNSDTHDVQGHGTAVAGTIAAVGQNGLGIASIAWGCRLMPLRVCDQYGNGTIAAISSALIYAADHGAKVANISFVVSSSQTVSNAAFYFRTRGGIVIEPSGNDSGVLQYANNPVIITVGATDSNDALATFSNGGAPVDLSAPGVTIKTTVIGGGYGYATGTCSSSALVSGVGALVFSVNPTLTPGQVEQILETTADDLGAPGWDPGFGWGRVNAYKAVQAALALASGDIVAPIASVTSPVAGVTLAGSVNVAASATDNLGVTKLEVYANGVLLGSSASGSATISWDTTKGGNGSYNIQARTYDAAGNVGYSPVVTVSVQNPVPDTTAPTVSVTNPVSGSTVTGNVSVTATATDASGISQLEFVVNGVVAVSYQASSATYSWDTTEVANGSYSVTARATDTAGNVGTSAIMILHVQNPAPDTTPPTVKVITPSSGSTASGSVSVTIEASDDVGVTKVEWYLNGNLMGISATAPAVFTWKTRNYAAGAYQIQAQAYDAVGNRGTAPTVTVFIGSSDKTAPTVQTTSPSSGSTIAGPVTVTVNATDNVGVSKVEWYVDGTLMGASQQANPVFSWDTLGIPDGLHTLQARAYDAAGNSAVSEQVSAMVHNVVVDSTAPVVVIESPIYGATSSSATSVSVKALDDTGITRLELYADGRLVASATKAPAVFKWLPKSLNRSHTLQAMAYDAAGNQGVSSIVTVYPQALAQPMVLD